MTLSPIRITDGVRIQTRSGWYFNDDSTERWRPSFIVSHLSYTDHVQTPMPSCSKGPRGLSVLLRVTSIFTVLQFHRVSWLRQCSSRYAIRAGRNLPDKEFRYLRTVIVTAAVYRGFSSELRLALTLPLTFQHRAGVSPYTSSYDFAETCVFVKQSLEPFRCDLQLRLCNLHAGGTPSPEVTGSFCRVP